ncbi:MAG: prepilin-type N-terminal cleavage/methylation domain-containing protein [Candidatus Delongbacteria bacterium]|nr:prepilin-type N-terminal cleavage/methylation domain-containing protein [Candidatus Delongbacteria bacterium]
MKKGFTLIEVMVVAVIVAVLAAVAIPAYNSYIVDAKVNVAKNTAATVAASAGAYYAKYQSVPGSLAAINVQLPADFEMPNEIAAGSPIVIQHTDGTASASVDWD